YLESSMLDTPAIAVGQVRKEVGHLGEIVLSMLEFPRNVEVRISSINGARLRESYKDVEVLSGEILSYVRKLYGSHPDPEDAAELEHLLDTVNQLRGISETVVNNLGTLVSEWRGLQLKASDATGGMIRSIHAHVVECVRDVVVAVQERDAALAGKVMAQKGPLYRKIDALSAHLGVRLQSDDPNRIENYRLESRVLEIERRVYYFAKRIAKTLVPEVE
ncbi:hypothetical protein N9Z83_03125, partial [Akkermansiaceae bacterium]|nr:hypothetical protein [Akkermansiaceae bacterium]